LAYRYAQAVSRIDLSNFNTAAANLALAVAIEASRAARAPKEVRASERELAASNSELVAQVKQRAPKTSTELRQALDAAQKAVNKKYPNLGHDTQIVQNFDRTNCGIG
jgi:hypothetical protein